MTRRDFSKMLPAPAVAGAGRAAGDRLNLAGIGVGGMGANYLRSLESENIVALCDVDEEYAARTRARYPKAAWYKDWRKLLESERTIDGVVIGTPDHTHFVIAMAAIQLGKHVYCAKPLTRTVWEARKLAEAARAARVATQMSVQSSMSDAACSTVEWVKAGVAGMVREVHVWSDRPIWPQGLARPTEKAKPPKKLDWELWLGPAPARPYHPAYHPFAWRGWVDFGTGAVGDMACHTLHIIARALDLEHPLSVHASASKVVVTSVEEVNGRRRRRFRTADLRETFPNASIITWDYPARGTQPPVQVTWYDGGLKPPQPRGMPPEQKLGNDGILFVGDKGTILSGFSGGPKLVGAPKDFEGPPKTLERTKGHYQEFAEAGKGGKPASCEFGFGGMLTEVAVIGTLAARLGRRLEWDPVNLRFPNDAEASQLIRDEYREGWRVS